MTPARPLLDDAAAIEYRVIRSARRHRTIEIAIEAGEVVVRAPLRTPVREIDELVRRRARWIARHRRVEPAPAAFVTGASIPYLGEPRELTVRLGSTRYAHIEQDLFGLRVTLPRRVGPEEHEAATQAALTAWLRARAAEALPHRIEPWARAMELRPRQVLVRDQRRRWGSCAPDGTLRFNWRLVMLDPTLIDYVAVHELAHLREANHGPRFWRLVQRALPDAAERRARLREAGRALPL